MAKTRGMSAIGRTRQQVARCFMGRGWPAGDGGRAGAGAKRQSAGRPIGSRQKNAEAIPKHLCAASERRGVRALRRRCSGARTLSYCCPISPTLALQQKARVGAVQQEAATLSFLTRDIVSSDRPEYDRNTTVSRRLVTAGRVSLAGPPGRPNKDVFSLPSSAARC